MGRYTDSLEEKTYALLDAEDYTAELDQAAKAFRTFDAALDEFLLLHGYSGKIGDVDEKVGFISGKMRAEGIPVPRNMKKWFTEHRTIEKKTAFLLCFAFGLSLEEANDFFRRICLFRGFDCHSEEEAVYFYGFRNGLKYPEVARILERVTLVKPGNMETENVVFTVSIVEALEELTSEDALVEFLTGNADKFRYNNVTATQLIRRLWEEIAAAGEGLAGRERKLLYMEFSEEAEEGWQDGAEDVFKGQKEDGKGNSTREQKEGGKGNIAQEQRENVKENAELQGKSGKSKRKERKRETDSLWEIYLQILGLAGSNANVFYKDRSLKPMLKDNVLLHHLAEDSFPDRDGLTKVLNGVHVSEERVRKLLILLVFYRFWANRALKKRNYKADYGDTQRCIANIDDFLTEAGYPSLYFGNPYDFIFLYACGHDTPLLGFRGFMQELYYAGRNMPDAEKSLQ